MKGAIPPYGDSPCLAQGFSRTPLHPTAEPPLWAAHALTDFIVGQAYSLPSPSLNLFKLIQCAVSMRQNIQPARIAFICIEHKIGDDVIFSEGGFK